jgi:hypothetical protein
MLYLLQALDLYVQNHFDAFYQDLQALDILFAGLLHWAGTVGS